MNKLPILNFISRHKIISFLQDIDIIGIRKTSLTLPRLIIPKPNGKLIIKTLHGFFLEVDPVKDIGVERSIYYTGTYEKGTLFVIKNILKEGSIFVDIGANIGLMSIFSSSIVKNKGHVYSFEPNPATSEILNRNIELNSISNITSSNFAIGSKAEKTKIYDRWDVSRGGATLIKPENETGSYEISVISLVNYFKDEEQRIDLIKIDVEGFELEVLEGSKSILKRKTPPMLIVECSEMRENSMGFSKETLFDFIKEVNEYKLFKSSGSKGRTSKLIEITKQNEMPNHDNIYCFTNKHLNTVPKKIFK